MALFDKFKKKDKDALEAYPTMTPNLDIASPGLGPAGVPSTPGSSGLPPLPTSTAPAPITTSPQMEILQNKIEMLISKIDALKSALDVLNQKINQQEQPSPQPNPVDQKFDIYGGSGSSQTPSSGEQQGSDYNSSGWQF